MRALFPLAFAAMLHVPTAHAQVVGDPDLIRVFMTEFGLPATLSTDGEGDPLIESRIDGSHFSVYFYNCTKICGSIQFSAGFDLDRPMSLEQVNQWNTDRRFGKLYVDDAGDPFIEMDVGLAGEGIGRKNFEDALDTWRIVLSDFRGFIDW